jgi:hypothetical protein
VRVLGVESLFHLFGCLLGREFRRFHFGGNICTTWTDCSWLGGNGAPFILGTGHARPMKGPSCQSHSDLGSPTVFHSQQTGWRLRLDCVSGDGPPVGQALGSTRLHRTTAPPHYSNTAAQLSPDETRLCPIGLSGLRRRN